MKAHVLHGVNQLRMEEVNTPVLGDDEVLVRVKNAGICGSDIPRIFTMGAHKHPLIPGHEFAGEVVEDKTGEWNGKRVGIFPLIPCKTCPQCKKQQYEMCQDYNYLGSRCDGGFAEYVAVPKWNLLELPDTVDFQDAAMLEPMAVAAHAMRAINPGPEDVVAVYGLGTIGLLLTMLLKEAGIGRILVIGNKDIQREKAIEIGVQESDFCDLRTEQVDLWINEKTNGRGVECFFECVGKNETIVEAIDVTAHGGKIMLVGNPHSDMWFEKDNYWKILRKQLALKGTWNSSYTGEDTDDWHYVLDRIAAGRIAPSKLISHCFSLEDLESGLHIMRDKTEEYVKVMIEY